MNVGGRNRITLVYIPILSLLPDDVKSVVTIGLNLGFDRAKVGIGEVFRGRPGFATIRGMAVEYV